MENGKNIGMKKIYNRMRIGDNSGFTLMELLIAMIILAVALIPMLNSFAVNAKVNRKAKIKLRSTMIAQDIMEGIKGYSTKDVYKQFTGVNDFRLIENEGVVNPSDHKVISANVTVSSADADALVNRYTMKDLVYQGQKYDATIDIDGTTFTGLSGNRLNLSGNKIQPNSDELADLSVMDSHFDGIFMSDNYNSRQEFLEKLIDLNGWLGSKITRTFEIELKDAGVTAIGNPKQVATVKVTYETVSAGSVTVPYSRNYTAYNNIDVADDGCSIRSLYFFYYPAYNGNYVVDGSEWNITYMDRVIFKNPDAIPITLYVMKQKTTDPLLLSELYLKESMYTVEMTIDENNPMTGVSPSIDMKKTVVCTNLMKNLYDPENPALSPGNVYWRYGAPSTHPPEANTTAVILGADKTLSTRTVNRMFDAVIKVYEEGAADAGFPDHMMLTTLDSTKINQ